MTGEQWLTYQQAADLFGMSSEAVRQRARRLGWRTQRANDGKTLVLVPPDTPVQPRVRPSVETPVQPGAQPPVQSPEIEVLSVVVNTLRDQLDKVQGQLDQERRQHMAERTRLAEELQTERTRHRDDMQAEKARHAQDVTWHRAEIDLLQKQLAELRARPWWQFWKAGA